MLSNVLSLQCTQGAQLFAKYVSTSFLNILRGRESIACPSFRVQIKHVHPLFTKQHAKRYQERGMFSCACVVQSCPLQQRVVVATWGVLFKCTVMQPGFLSSFVAECMVPPPLFCITSVFDNHRSPPRSLASQHIGSGIACSFSTPFAVCPISPKFQIPCSYFAQKHYSVHKDKWFCPTKVVFKRYSMSADLSPRFHAHVLLVPNAFTWWSTWADYVHAGRVQVRCWFWAHRGHVLKTC